MARGSFLAGVAVLICASAGSLAVYGDDEVRRPGEPECARGYRYESYGMGLGEGFLDLVLSGEDSDYFHPRCYELGYMRGREIALAHSDSPKFCNAAFDRSMNEALEALPPVVHTPSDCSNAGFNYGEARLRRSARAGDADLVGAGCVSEYERGFEDASKALASLPKDDRKLAECYRVGYWDGSVSHGVPTGSGPRVE